MKKVYVFSTLLFVSTLLISQKAHAQFDFVVEPCADSAAVIALVDTVFLAGMPPESIANITFYGDPTSVGYYSDGHFLGFETTKGMIMTNGKSDDADKSNICNSAQNASTNNSGVENDPDLELLSGASAHDGCIIEFDYKSTDDTVRFNYVFASEEYHDYVTGLVNDMFGFFLSGPGITGPYTYDAKFVALIPGSSTGVAVNTINFGHGGLTCTGKPTGCTNCEWLKDNSQMSDPAFNRFVYDALTKPLVAKLGIQAGEWNHIKMAIGDGGDAIYDSGVLLEKGSFTTRLITDVSEILPNKTQKLLQVAPNPFDESTLISAQWEYSANVRIEIYSNTGQCVKMLKLGNSSTDNIQIQWYGRDQNGNILPSGIYHVLMFLDGIKVESLRIMKK